MPNYCDMAAPSRLLRSVSATKLAGMPGTWSDPFDSAEHDRIAAIPGQYRKVSGPGTDPALVVEMTAGEKAAVDAAAATAADDSEMSTLDLRNALAALALVVMDEVNRHATTITAILDAADNAANLAAFKADMAAIADEPTRTVAQLKAAIRARLEGL